MALAIVKTICITVIALSVIFAVLVIYASKNDK